MPTDYEEVSECHVRHQYAFFALLERRLAKMQLWEPAPASSADLSTDLAAEQWLKVVLEQFETRPEWH
jgi:hypothetical protein